MSRLLDTERTLYRDVWSGIANYGDFSPGEQYAPVFTAMARPRSTVLDAGTGSGRGALALEHAGFSVRACDVTRDGLVPDAHGLSFVEACLWHDLGPVVRGFGHPSRTSADWVYCTDVLEHLPPQFTMLAVEQMLRVSAIGLFLTVSLVPDSFGVWAGKSLHQTVQSFTWWRDSLRELGIVSEARDLLHNALFVVNQR